MRDTLENGTSSLAAARTSALGLLGLTRENNVAMVRNRTGGVTTLFIVYSTGMVVVPGPVSELAASLRPSLRFMARKKTASRLLRV